MDRLLTTREAAEILAVGPTSVKRWADMGLLPCVKTAGGHRRFPESEVKKFLDGQPDEEEGAGHRLDPWVDLLVSNTSGYTVEARLLDARGDAGSWWQVAEVLGEVLVQIGALWEAGDLTVIEEHMASERLHRALARVSDLMPQSKRAPLCLLIGADEDPHTLGLSLAEVCAREAGWRTTWAGRSTPVEDVIEIIEGGTVDMLAISASIWSSDRRRLRRQVQKLGAACDRHGVELILGGSGAWPENLPHGVRVTSFSEFHSLLTKRRKR